MGLGRMATVRSPLSAEELLRFPVRLDGIDVGRAVDLFVDPQQKRAVGLDVLCRDDVHRFLPLAAAEVGQKEIRLSSPFTLVEGVGLDFYREWTSSLRALKGTHVERRGRDLGAIRDAVVSPDGEITAFVLASGDDELTVPAEPELRIDANGRNGSG
jgi:hypothetical protein